MEILIWILNYLLVPLLCSTYSSLIVVRYIEFSQLRSRAEEVVAKTRTYHFMLSYEGLKSFKKANPTMPGQIAPLFQFGELHTLSGKLRDRGHIQAADEAQRMQAVLLRDGMSRVEHGQYSEADWEKHIAEREQFPRDPRDNMRLKPTLSALFTFLRWNI